MLVAGGATLRGPNFFAEMSEPYQMSESSQMSELTDLSKTRNSGMNENEENKQGKRTFRHFNFMSHKPIIICTKYYK
jgi:hypothetical protein